MDKDDFLKSIDLDDMPPARLPDSFMKLKQEIPVQFTLDMAKVDVRLEEYLLKYYDYKDYAFIYQNVIAVVNEANKTVTFKPRDTTK